MQKYIPFNKDDISNDIRQKFGEAGYDITSDTSNISTLIELLSYASSIVNTNTAFGLSDLTLINSTQRKNILSLARQLGYEARLRTSFQYKIYLKPLEPISTPTVLTIPKYQQFESDGLYFYNMIETITVDIDSSNFTDGEWNGDPIEVIVKEGLLKKYYDENYEQGGEKILVREIEKVAEDSENLETYLDIPFLDIEEDGIEVFVQDYNNIGEVIKQQWQRRREYIVEKDEGSQLFENKFVQLRNIQYNTSRIYFKFAGIGNNLLEGTKIYMNLLQSSGASGKPTERITGTVPNFEVLTSLQSETPYVSGADEESDDSVKLNAPLFYNSGNRLVTSLDYETMLEREPLVQSSYVWGGEEELTKQLGYVWFALYKASRPTSFINENETYYHFFRKDLLEGREYFLTDADLEKIKTSLNVLKIMTIQLNTRQPMFIDFHYDITIAQYNSLTKAYVHTEFFKALGEYFFETLEDFENKYFNSNVVKMLDNILGEKSGFDMELKLTVPFFKKQIVKEDGFEDKFIFMMNVPYEDYIDSENKVIAEQLPEISKASYAVINNDNYDLYVDFNTDLGNNDISIYEMPINIKRHTPKYNDYTDPNHEIPLWDIRQVGTYYLINNYKYKYIRMELLTGTVESPESLFDEPVVMDLDVKSNNFNLIKTSIPRLNSIKFN